jgi:hypothetical protein
LAASEQRCKETELRCSEAEQLLAEQPPAQGGDEQELEDLRRRCEMALQDVRDLKSQNAELQREVDARRRPSSSSGGAAAGSIVGGDWESQKKRLMQQLEEEYDTTNTEEAEDKSFVEEAMRVTEQVVAEKDREIQELQRLLSDQSSNIGGLAVGATAIASVLDQDELIREERESLKRLQDEWREKLKQSEVDISLERAKLARERTELEEKLRQLAAAKTDVAAGESGTDSTKKTRRWLSLLVKDSDGK